MSKISRVIIIVLDSVGIGEMPDAGAYGDAGSHTLGNIAEAMGGLDIPNLQLLGLGNIEALEGVAAARHPQACYGKMAELSAGKDTTTGHWEMMGLVLEEPFPTYPNGFPEELIAEFRRRSGHDILGNTPASGTQIIDELGAEHLATGKLIVYTSADSVFQIAAHEELVPIEELYKICEEARNLLQGKHGVGRVIARPFIGQPGHFTRTSRRKDFSRVPHLPTVLDHAKAAGLPVNFVGKIDNIFANRGLTGGNHTTNDMAGVDATIDYMGSQERGILLTNLCDFDMLYGHRNNVEGYARNLRDFDARLPEILDAVRDSDMLAITADHGCDPTFPGTDHTREYVPLLVYGSSLKAGVDLGLRQSFADLAATTADMLELPAPRWGKSFKELL
ncbi:phosphopentomutase [candidate division KSB3 bacterium]|uniref:Phosphopentomutase n=1 Tax=candidate division KSB3 bacterium TaxID=2044937 RepID=A0A2G6E1Q5_9BACT|nr:MAG: phosphopentomutase [candidate division KSB3 bacterium]PIE28678.1 MAG: phosphopentomutase [candidate division KSB3 bacterium]